MTFNGPSRELGPDEHLIRQDGDSELVYCVACGNTFVWANGRDCPTCTIAEALALDKDPSDVELDVSGGRYQVVKGRKDDR